MAKAFNPFGGMGSATAATRNPGGVFQRGGGGIFPERGSEQQMQMVMQALQGANSSVGQSGSPLLALLAPLASGAIGARTQGLYKDAQKERDSSAIDILLSSMGGGGGMPSMPTLPPGGAAPAVRAENPFDKMFPTGQTGPAPQGNIDPASGLNMGQPVGPSIPEPIKNGIFAGESGGDYDALFGFSNRDGGKYSNVKLTDMSVDQALEFANPSGDYGQWVKGQVGRVATPMGAYQIVGTTLRAAKNALGLTGNERMTEELQDQLGAWIYQNQGTGAWEGYRGPQDSFQPGPGVQVAQNSYAGGAGTPFIPQTSGSTGGPSRELLELLVQPGVSDPLRELAGTMIGSRMSGGMSPTDQLKYQKAQIDLMKALSPKGTTPVRVGDALVNPDTGEVVYNAPPDPAKPVTPIEVGGALVNPQTGEVVYEAPKDQRDARGRGELSKQYNQAAQMLTEAIQFEQNVNGLTEPEARAKVLSDPLYRRQIELLQIAEQQSEGGGTTSTAPPPPPGTVPY